MFNDMLTTIEAHNQFNRHPANNNNSDTSKHNIYLVVPYINGLRKSFKKVCNEVGVQDHFKGNNTIPNLLVTPKDKITITQKVG